MPSVVLAELDRNLLDGYFCHPGFLQDGQLYLAADSHGVDANQLESVCIANPNSVYGMAEALDSDLPIIRQPTDPMGRQV